MEVANKTLPAYIEGQRNIIYAWDVGLGLVRVCEVGKPGGSLLVDRHQHNDERIH